jgi:sec-independent protein translocase protein TatB
MPQIGWFEILIVVVLSVVIIGPKDFPIVVRKIGTWVGTVKRYFGEVQKTISDVEDSVKEEASLDEELSKHINDKEKNER